MSIRTEARRLREAVFETLRVIFKRLGIFMRLAKPAIKALLTKEFKMITAILRKEGLKKMKELDQIIGQGKGALKGKNWNVWAKDFLKDYFSDVGQAWKKDHRVPERMLNRVRETLFSEHKP